MTGGARRQTARPSKSWRFPLLIIAGLGITPILVLTREVFAANHCADAGGSYDYFRALCYMTPNGVSRSALPGPLAWVGLLFMAKVGAVVMFGSVARGPLVIFTLAAVGFAAARRKMGLRSPRSSSKAAA